jgi:hypothetical protein
LRESTTPPKRSMIARRRWSVTGAIPRLAQVGKDGGKVTRECRIVGPRRYVDNHLVSLVGVLGLGSFTGCFQFEVKIIAAASPTHEFATTIQARLAPPIPLGKVFVRVRVHRLAVLTRYLAGA